MNEADKVDLMLFLKYPCISKYLNGNNQRIYKGTICVDAEDYYIEIKETDGNMFICNTPPQYEKELKTLIQTKPGLNIVEVLDICHSFMLENIQKIRLWNKSSIYEKVLFEYHDFTKFYLNIKTCFLAKDLREIKISMMDERNREHFLRIAVNEETNDENIFSISEYDLPCEREYFKSNCSLRELYKQFVNTVDSLQPFFDLMEDFDKICCILDPIPVMKKHNFRKIYVENKLAIIVTVNPFDVFQIPDIKFLGLENHVKLYYERFNTVLRNWKPDDYVIQKLLELLDIESFPQKPATDNSNADQLLVNCEDCSICFLQRLDDKTPDIVCKNKLCVARYHVMCLHEWLKSSTYKTYFHEIIGDCPNCGASVICPEVKDLTTISANEK